MLERAGGEVLSHERSVLLESGDVLLTGVAGSPHITYERPPDTTRQTSRNCLDLRVTVDGAEVSSYTTATGCVTIGRSHRDIDRPDISRSHGALELDNNGWAYVHRSAAGPSAIVRDGAPVARLERGDSAPVRQGDELRLTECASLFIG
ncbi:FHA domain-containing protein [Streptomyces sp. NK15101]|uniref:FHA domain-containing protein n=1 Tax=Streptomyces sp. NK15101 TaxID=2873261 RepID=UPI001CEDD595|nr:FHA domain-containing protein [Streptomyces sp. NK15101]